MEYRGKKVLVILGPTATGKTSVSICLARQIGGEIISADSMQVYRYMDIGTAKASEEERMGVRHYLIDEVDPDQDFSVAKFQSLALKYIEEVFSRGKIPIVVGGTGLYINSLVQGYDFADIAPNNRFRERLRRLAEKKGNSYLHAILKKVDPVSAEKIHENNLKRVIRALEFYKHAKKPISQEQGRLDSGNGEYSYILIGLTMDRKKLYERINRRVDLMVEKGLEDEVRRLLDMGYGRELVSMQGLGYKEMAAYLRGEATSHEAVNLIKRNTRRYAKRQVTWFKRLKDVCWIDVEAFRNKLEIVENIKHYIATYGIII